jgi:hypothetical protein
MNRGIEDARRLLCVQEAYNFHHFIRDQVVHHPSAGSVPSRTLLRLWDVYLLERPDLFTAMAVAIVWVYRGTSFQFLQWSLTFPIAYYIDHITSGSANFETALSLLSSFFVSEDDDALLPWIEQILATKSCDCRSHSGVRTGCNSLHQVGMAMRCCSVASVLSQGLFFSCCFRSNPRCV